MACVVFVKPVVKTPTAATARAHCRRLNYSFGNDESVFLGSMQESLGLSFSIPQLIVPWRLCSERSARLARSDSRKEAPIRFNFLLIPPCLTSMFRVPSAS